MTAALAAALAAAVAAVAAPSSPPGSLPRLPKSLETTTADPDQHAAEISLLQIEYEAPARALRPNDGHTQQHIQAYSEQDGSKARHSTARHSTARHSTAHYSTARHSAALHNTARHSSTAVWRGECPPAPALVGNCRHEAARCDRETHCVNP
jgi:hypothetical protein